MSPRFAGLFLALGTLPAQIPHHQDRVPNEPHDPKTALSKMTVPEGFTVELVAAEPDIVNPIAMAFDEKGRIWITESLEYPRKSPGKGRDRVKVLEDTDRDGKIDKVTIFAEGLNIPSGIAVGHGGVWVANAPDLLFMQDTDGDLKADKIEVIATGFGREDTHELPNSLSWGPDGRLYGLNGVFNRCRVTQDLDKDGKPDDGKTWKFTCAMFRIDPLTKKFSLFCEGTSNPWGIAFDENGSAFISACVIDHLWHLVETGYYHRQGGAYPEHVWKLGSIVAHRHQKAAYCGITWFDSDAYPEEYRGVLYMGNIHGNCLNADVLERRGSSYFAKPRKDFLSVDDAWFMPVAQKTGPDGCLYVLDWYDRYHCYQDANRDPKGIDRLKGRLYRIRFGDPKPQPRIDLTAETDAALMQRLGSPNVFLRRTAQRLLAERDRDATRPLLRKMALGTGSRKTRLHALWTLVSTGRLDPEFHLQILRHEDPTFRAWGVRAAGNFGAVEKKVWRHLVTLSSDPSPDVRLQLAIATRKIPANPDPIATLLAVLLTSDDDPVIPSIVWQNLHPLLVTRSERFLSLVQIAGPKENPGLTAILPRVTERLLADAADVGVDVLLDLFELIAKTDTESARRCLAAMVEMLRTGQLPKASARELRARLAVQLGAILERGAKSELFTDAALLAALWGDARGLAAAQSIAADRQRPDELRLRALDVLIENNDARVIPISRAVLADAKASRRLAIDVLGSLGRLDDGAVAGIVLGAFPELRPAIRPASIDLLTQRKSWCAALLDALESKKIPTSALNGHQIQRLRNQLDGDAATIRRIARTFGVVRKTRAAHRDEVIAEIGALLKLHRGDPAKGRDVFATACGQCHKIWGKGADIGPDLTGNGRGSFTQLLSNVLDPNLVVGEAYQLRSVITHDDRIVGGMLAEKNDKRVVIRTVGGKSEVIAMKDVQEILHSPLSFMPEGLESTMRRDQLIDLFAFLVREKPPESKDASTIPGYAYHKPRETKKRRRFASIVAAVAPGFGIDRSGEGGVALLQEHLGRPCVVRTHPPRRGQPAVLHGHAALPKGKQAVLELSVAHHESEGEGKACDWRLLVKVDGDTLHDQIVGPETTTDGWLDVRIDLGKYAGKRVRIELHNHPNNWNYEFGYWGRVALVIE